MYTAQFVNRDGQLVFIVAASLAELAQKVSEARAA
jgi:hypothetical protein